MSYSRTTFSPSKHPLFSCHPLYFSHTGFFKLFFLLLPKDSWLYFQPTTPPPPQPPPLPTLNLRFYLFLARRERREKEAEKLQCVVACHMPPTGDLASNTGMCPDWELNQQPFALIWVLHTHHSSTKCIIFVHSILSPCDICLFFHIQLMPTQSMIPSYAWLSQGGPI